METNKKLITIPLSQFLEILWSYTDKTYVDNDLALLIQALDKEEQFCHVEFPSDGIHIHMEDRPRVWRIKDWKSDYDKYVNDKAHQDLQRLQWNIMKENKERLIKKLMYELETDDREMVMPLVDKLLRKQSTRDFVRSHLKVYVEEIPEK